MSGGTWSAIPHFFLYSQAHNSADCIHGIIKATEKKAGGREGGWKMIGRKGLGDAEPSGRFRGRSTDEIVEVHRKAGRTAEAARLSRIIVRRTR